MTILVTGSAGMLGTDVLAVLKGRGHTALGVDIRASDRMLDITDPTAVSAAFHEIRPDAVVHCAAYTNVDGAETDTDIAYRLNALGTWSIAQACRRYGVRLCYVSTDYVFDGTKRQPYHEFDVPHPINAYGETKLAGERAACTACPDTRIVRTAWLYGLNGRAFPGVIIRAAREGRPLRVVADQVGSPTFTVDLAEAIADVLDAPHGTYHCTNAGQTSWYEFARHALQFANIDPSVVEPIRTRDWPSAACRPRYSVMTSLMCPSVGLSAMRPWENALASYVAAYCDECTDNASR